jgi:hypothetical protein
MFRVPNRQFGVNALHSYGCRPVTVLSGRAPGNAVVLGAPRAIGSNPGRRQALAARASLSPVSLLGSGLRAPAPPSGSSSLPATTPTAGALEHYGGTTGSKLSLFGRERPCSEG